MVTRKQITLIYSYNDNWIGGTYYILNIIKALSNLPDELKPDLLILHDENSPLDKIEHIQYPFISYRSHDLGLGFFQRAINKVFFYINGKHFFRKKLPSNIGQNVYPLTAVMEKGKIKNGLYWIADLQEFHLPHFFSKFEIRARKMMYKNFVDKKYPIVFSSKTAANDFDHFFKSNHNPKFVLNFASFIGEDYKKINIDDLLLKYKIDKQYFIVSNQFWKHKNHQVVLEAIEDLLQKEKNFKVVFTGKEYDYRNPEYTDSLKDYIKSKKISDYVLFLGFIDRDEQLQLMANAISIIQPSLFEGWSTVVEDAKVVNQYILLSDIPLHREQIDVNCSFFKPDDSKELSLKMLDALVNKKQLTSIDYGNTQTKFAKDFLKMFN